MSDASDKPEFTTHEHMTTSTIRGLGIRCSRCRDLPCYALVQREDPQCDCECHELDETVMALQDF